MPYSDVYDRLVKDDGDISGQVAYGIYKKLKREFVRKKQSELGVTIIPNEILEEFYATQTDYTLELYQKHAKRLTREFLDISRNNGLIVNTTRNTRNSRMLSSPSFWYGVL